MIVANGEGEAIVVYMEPTDAQLPLEVRRQATGFRALSAAAAAFLASAVPLGGATGAHRVPGDMLDRLVRAANEGESPREVDPATARVGVGLTARQLRGLWRFQRDQFATLRLPAQRLWLACLADPADNAFRLAEACHLAALREALREVAADEEHFAAALRAAAAT